MKPDSFFRIYLIVIGSFIFSLCLILVPELETQKTLSARTPILFGLSFGISLIGLGVSNILDESKKVEGPKDEKIKDPE